MWVVKPVHIDMIVLSLVLPDFVYILHELPVAFE